MFLFLCLSPCHWNVRPRFPWWFEQRPPETNHWWLTPVLHWAQPRPAEPPRQPLQMPVEGIVFVVYHWSDVTQHQHSIKSVIQSPWGITLSQTLGEPMCFSLYIVSLAQDLPHSRCSMEACERNEWMNPCSPFFFFKGAYYSVHSRCKCPIAKQSNQTSVLKRNPGSTRYVEAGI